MALDVLKATVGMLLSVTGERYQTGASKRSGKANYRKQIEFSVGTGVVQCDEAYAAVRTLAGGASETIDLTAALTNLVGDTLVPLARVKAFLVWLLGTTSVTDSAGEGSGAVTGTACSSITFGNAAANQFKAGLGAGTHTWTVHNGGFILAVRQDATGWATSSADQLKVVNDDGAVSAKYVLGLLGAAT